MLEQFGLAHRRRSPFAGLSGGERQRLFLVLALLNQPRLVILDELTQGLDPAARRDVWAAVAQLRDGGTTVPSHWYVASYFTVVIGAIGLIMLPVHIATYRERGVLRRFAAAGFPRWSFACAQAAVGLVAVAVGGGLLLAVAAPVYGVPTPDQPLRVVAGVVTAALAFVSIGLLLGTVLPSARAAQATGLLLFFSSFLLGVGGPPPSVMPDSLRAVADRLPLALANEAIREPWLGLGSATGPLVATVGIATAATLLAGRRSAL